MRTITNACRCAIILKQRARRPSCPANDRTDAPRFSRNGADSGGVPESPIRTVRSADVFRPCTDRYLLAGNVDKFARVPNLTIESWVDES